jgi:hypothetical protein
MNLNYFIDRGYYLVVSRAGLVYLARDGCVVSGDPVTAVIGGAALIGGAATYFGGKEAGEGAQAAADTTAAATDKSTAATLEMFYKGLGLQEPYRESGYRALTSLERELYGSSFNPTLYDQYAYPGSSPPASTVQRSTRYASTTPVRYTQAAPTTGDRARTMPISPTDVLTRQPVRERAGGILPTTTNPYPQISTELSPLYQLQLQEGERNINRALSARGLFNSGPGLESLSNFYRQLGATESARKQALMQLLAGYGGDASASGANAAMSVGNSLGSIYTAGGQNTAAALLAQGNARAGMYSGIGNSINAGLNSYMQYQGMQNYANQPVQYYGQYELPWKY